jgi:hypothetical protein
VGEPVDVKRPSVFPWQQGQVSDSCSDNWRFLKATTPQQVIKTAMNLTPARSLLWPTFGYKLADKSHSSSYSYCIFQSLLTSRFKLILSEVAFECLTLMFPPLDVLGSTKQFDTGIVGDFLQLRTEIERNFISFHPIFLLFVDLT